MDKRLKLLFDYQRFQNNGRLAGLIEKTEKKYSNELSDEMLELVNAAGDTDLKKTKKTVVPEDSEDD